MKLTMKQLTCTLALTGLALLTADANAVTVVDDHFDDGDITTNTTGIGTGFASGDAGPGSGYLFIESGTIVTTDSPTNGGRRSFMASNEFADTTTALGATYLFENVNFAVSPDDSGDGTTRRQYFGVRDTAGANDAQLNPGEGFFVEIGSGDLSGNAFGTSNFFYNDASNVKTTLATWTFDTLSITDAGVTNAELDVTIGVSATGWSIDITGDTQGGNAVSFSGTHAASSITNGVDTGYVFAYNQSESPNLSYSIDRIVVDQVVPEPSSLALLGLGGLLIARRRRG